MLDEKRVQWDEEKNKKLQLERGISFEEVYAAIQSEHLLDIIPHPNPAFSHQKIYVVEWKGYVVMVPFVEDEEKIFLKTAYPSRKAAKEYNGRKQS